MLSEQSTKEEVAEYLKNNCKLDENIKNKLIEEDISGDILLEIQDNEFKSLGIKVGPLKKIKKVLEEKKSLFKQKEFKDNITAISKPEEVKSFFERCLNFKKDLNGLDGKGLIELDEKGMEKLGLNLGQRKKLVKYIAYFKTLKIDEEEKGEFMITKKSSEQEVGNFLKKKLRFSQSSIDALQLDGESFLMLEPTEVDALDEIEPEERENLKKFLSEAKLSIKGDNEEN